MPYDINVLKAYIQGRQTRIHVPYKKKKKKAKSVTETAEKAAVSVPEPPPAVSRGSYFKIIRKIAHAQLDEVTAEYLMELVSRDHHSYYNV